MLKEFIKLVKEKPQELILDSVAILAIFAFFYFMIILGAILGPTLFLAYPEWSVLIGGTAAGTIAFVVGENYERNF